MSDLGNKETMSRNLKKYIELSGKEICKTSVAIYNLLCYHNYANDFLAPCAT